MSPTKGAELGACNPPRAMQRLALINVGIRVKSSKCSHSKNTTGSHAKPTSD